MERVHPVFMDKVADDIKAGRVAEANNGLQEGLQYWANVISDEFNPIDPSDAPLIIATLKNFTHSLCMAMPGAEGAADALLARTKARTFVRHVKYER